jgi:sec-independent protein translocase protein TatC
MATNTNTPHTIIEGSELSILEHLGELRIRATWAAIGWLIATIVSFVFAGPLLEFLLKPYIASGITPDGSVPSLQTLSPTENIETFFKVSLLAGFVLAMPIILHQFWIFISPGLTKSERRYVFLFLPSTIFLFLLGIAFAWFVLMPAAILFLANFLPEIFTPGWTGQEYIGFVLSMLFYLGLSFEMPVIVYVLGRVGILEGNVLREQWRFAVVGIAVLAAIITPSIDPITMMLTMAPLLVLYVVSIYLAKFGYRQFEKTVEIES